MAAMTRRLRGRVDRIQAFAQAEVEQAREFLNRYTQATGAAPGKASERAAWTALCQALFASAEFLHRN